MKRTGLISLLLGLGVTFAFSQDSIVTIPDTLFLYDLIEDGVDTNGDSLISYGEAQAVTHLDIGDLTCTNLLPWQICWAVPSDIKSIEGIHAFINLETLSCWGVNVSNLDVSGFSSLTELWCNGSEITSLDVSDCTALNELHLRSSKLTNLDVSGCYSLDLLECYESELTSLDASDCIALEELYFHYSIVSSLNVSGCNSLAMLWFSDDGYNELIEVELTSLDVSYCTALRELHLDSMKLTSLNVSGCSGLKSLHCDYNQLTSLDVSGCISLNNLYCGYNQLTSLDVSNNLALRNLDCRGNYLTHLDISNNRELGSQLYLFEMPKTLDISDMPLLHEVCVWVLPFSFGVLGINNTGSPNVCFETDCNGECESTSVESCNDRVLSIYPNPTGEILNIETEYPDNYSIWIASLNGQLILSKEMRGTTHQIDLSSFEKGVYFITITSKDFVTTRKVVKL